MAEEGFTLVARGEPMCMCSGIVNVGEACGVASGDNVAGAFFGLEMGEDVER